MRSRSPGVVVLAIVSIAVLGVTPMLGSAFLFGMRTLMAKVALLNNEGWIMGGTANPEPDPGYVSQVLGLYLQPQPPLFPGQPTFPDFHFQGLTTPEQACPVVCLPPPNPNLNLGDSVQQGVGILDSTIRPELANGDNVAVFGYSQSAMVATQEMNDLIDKPPAGLDASNLHVVLVGDPNSPVGGILDRFQFPDGIKPFSLEPAPQHLPFLNIPLSMDPTPTGPFPTDIYTAEYDGWANFPQDPTNVLAVVNALIGIQTVHPYYPDPVPTVNLDIDHVIDLGSIGNTNFYAIPAPLPVLAFMYDGGPAGMFFYDAFNPGLSLINNWGYGNPGDPGAGIPVDGIDPIHETGPWAVVATGQLAQDSGVAGFFIKMDPLQMLAGAQYAGTQSIVGPIDDVLQDTGQGSIPASVVQILNTLSGYDFTNELDQFLLTGWTDLVNGLPGLSGLDLAAIIGPNAIFDGAPLISGAPLIYLVGVGFDVFNFFGA